MSTFNAENFRNVFAEILRNGWIADVATGEKHIDDKYTLLVSLGCDRNEVLNLTLDMADMLKGHFEPRYPRYTQIGGDVCVMRYPGDVNRFYCTLASWQYSPAAKSGNSL